jgi:DNA-binding MarR family transcriptional regulator
MITEQPISDASSLPAGDLVDGEYRALADFRFQIRRFLQFSEEAAHADGLEPQQHQFLLAVRAFDGAGGPAVGDIARTLLIKHHSAVGLTDRMVERGLVERVRDAADRREVHIRLTPEGKKKLMRLSSAHRVELLNSGPLLVESLSALLERLRQNRI